jgi:thiamine biosynthesis lipoprotein
MTRLPANPKQVGVATLLAYLVGMNASAGPQRYVFEKAEMGVPFRITLYAATEAEGKAASNAVWERVEVLNSILSDYDPDSELSRLSRTSGQGRSVPVSTDLWNVLSLAQRVSEKTDGALDVTVGPLVNLWRRVRRRRELPDDTTRLEMLTRVGYTALKLDPANRSVELTKPEMRLDVGGVAKGYAADEAMKVLKRRGITSALVAASGDMCASEPPPGKPGWRIQVAALDTPDAPPPRFVWLKNSAISTSGDTFQRVEINGVRYSHIVDPKTGIGLTDHGLVTVLGPDASTTDSLETTVSVMGPERGLALIEQTPGTAVYIVRKPAERVEVYESARWHELAGGE